MSTPIMNTQPQEDRSDKYLLQGGDKLTCGGCGSANIDSNIPGFQNWKFCSHKCHHVTITGDDPECRCTHCGEEIMCSPLLQNGTEFCSYDCMNTFFFIEDEMEEDDYDY